MTQTHDRVKYTDIYEDFNGSRPERMTNAEAADVLAMMKYNAVDERTKEAIDRAIAALQPNVMPTVESLLRAVTEETGVTEKQMVSKGRWREFSEARYMFFWLCHRYTGATHTAIGNRLNRSHVMVYYGIHRVDFWMSRPAANKACADKITNIINRISVSNG